MSDRRGTIMGMQVGCPHCGFVMTDDGSLAGQLVACPKCSGQLTMPGITPPPLANVLTAPPPPPPPVQAAAHRQSPVAPRSQSGLGLASLVIGITGTCFLAGSFVLARAEKPVHRISEVSGRWEMGSWARDLFVTTILCESVSGTVGLAMGIAALFQANRLQLAAKIGIALNAVPVLMVATMIFSTLTERIING